MGRSRRLLRFLSNAQPFGKESPLACLTESGPLPTLPAMSNLAPPGPSPRVVEWTTQVRPSETDGFGIAHHSNYVPWFEHGRIELLRALGQDYLETEAEGLAYPLVEMAFRYHAPLRLGEAFTVRCALVYCSRSRVVFGAQILDSKGNLASRAFSVHALVDSEMRPRSIPETFQDLVQTHAVGLDWLGKRFQPQSIRWGTPNP